MNTCGHCKRLNLREVRSIAISWNDENKRYFFSYLNSIGCLRERHLVFFWCSFGVICWSYEEFTCAKYFPLEEFHDGRDYLLSCLLWFWSSSSTDDDLVWHSKIVKIYKKSPSTEGDRICVMRFSYLVYVSCRKNIPFGMCFGGLCETK